MTDKFKDKLEGLNVLDLKPCLMVAATVSCQGGQSYKRRDEQKLDPTKEREQRSEWVTEKIIDDEDEFAEAHSLRRKCLYELGKLGRHIPVGFVAALERGPELRAFRDEWRAQFKEFNDRSRYTNIRFDFWIQRIQGENVENLEQLLDELRDGLGDLEQAYQTADPGTMRDVLRRMTGFTELLPEKVGMTLDGAIEAARKRANNISRSEKRVQRMQARIAEELGPDGDPQNELERLAAEPLTEDIRKRTRRLTRLNVEVNVAAAKLEAAKTEIDDAPIQLARFAMRRRRPSDTEQRDAQLAAEELMAVEAAARVGRAVRPAGYHVRSGARLLGA